VNNKVLTVIDTGPTAEGGFGSSGRLQEVGINHIYETCNDLSDGNIMFSVIFCAPVCLRAVRIFAKVTLAVLEHNVRLTGSMR
jgi:hypothetical protein